MYVQHKNYTFLCKEKIKYFLNMYFFNKKKIKNKVFKRKKCWVTVVYLKYNLIFFLPFCTFTSKLVNMAVSTWPSVYL